METVEDAEVRGGPQDDQNEGVAAFFVRHGPYLQELWVRLYRAAILFSATFGLAFFCAKPILAVLVRSAGLENVTLIATRPFQFIELSVDVGLFFAFLVGIPYFIWEVCMFLRPAVSAREFHRLLLTLPLSLFLFAGGFVFGVGVLFMGLQTLANLNLSIGISNYWDIGPFLSSAVVTATLLGALFQLPLLLTFCIRMGMCDVRALIRRRRVVWAAVLVFVALLPPADGFSLIVMAVPLVLLFELTILFNRRGIMHS